MHMDMRMKTSHAFEVAPCLRLVGPPIDQREQRIREDVRGDAVVIDNVHRVQRQSEYRHAVDSENRVLRRGM